MVELVSAPSFPATIASIVTVRSGYTSYVDLRSDLFNNGQNGARMSMYRPTASHRAAFQTLARSLNDKDNRCYLVTGAYGTGKSHLLLMFANYLQTPAGEGEMPAFLDNVAQVDPIAARELRAKRGQGRYLVALCEWGGKGTFEEIVLRAVDEALARAGIGNALETPYRQALRKLEEWQTYAREDDERAHFFEEFERKLADLQPGRTMDAFRKALRGFDPAALDAFRQIHRDITTAIFSYDKDNLRDILIETLSSPAFKDRFLGLLVLFDEFGDTLENRRMGPKEFQLFAQLCAESPNDRARLVFVGAAHKDFAAYGGLYDAVNFRTVSDRIASVPLTTDGVEDIIAAIITPDTDSSLWKEKVAPRSDDLDALVRPSIQFNLFDGRDSSSIRDDIIGKMYPMHPMATHALLALAGDVASNSRSVFTFFSGATGDDAVPGSYGDYVTRTPIDAGGRLNLYPADHLFDFFASRLTTDNGELREAVRQVVRDFEDAVRELNRLAGQDTGNRQQFLGDPLMARILRLMLIYEIIQTPSSLDALSFGLYCTSKAEKSALQGALKALIAADILYLNRKTDFYEFKRSSGVDIDRMVEDYKRDESNRPTNNVAALHLLIPFDRKGELYLDAKNYNQERNEDKRLERRLVSPVDLTAITRTPEGEDTYFDVLDGEIARQQTMKKGEYEGIAVYVACENADDIRKAKRSCASNRSSRVAVAVPTAPVSLLDAILTVQALEHVKGEDEFENFSLQDKSTLSDRLVDARMHLRGLRDKLLSARDVAWFGRDGKRLSTDDTNSYSPANLIMADLYAGEQNRVNHEDFNKLRQRGDLIKNTPLKEAVDQLLAHGAPVAIDTDHPATSGDMRYLKPCLLNTGVLEVRRQDRTVSRCEMAADPGKYKDKLPTLAAMIRQVCDLKATDTISIAAWVDTYRTPPYGQGPVALALFLACVRRAFGDSVSIRESDLIGDLPLDAYRHIVDLIEGSKYPAAYLSYRQLHPHERAILNAVYAAFGQPASAAARDYTIGEAHAALKEWWDALAPVARDSAVYLADGRPQTAAFVEALSKIETRDAYTFLLDDLPVAFGAEAGEIVTETTADRVRLGLRGERDAVDAALGEVERRIIEKVRAIFDVQQNTVTAITDSVRSWFDGLDASQRSSSAEWHTGDSKPLVQYLRNVTDLRAPFMDEIPGSRDYGLGKVSAWMTDQVDTYAGKLARGKRHIDANRVKVEPPTWSLEGDGARVEDGAAAYRGNARLMFAHPSPGMRMYIVEGVDNPAAPRGTPREIDGTTPMDIRGNRTLTVATQDADGNWSRPVTIRLTDEDKRHEIRPSAQRGLEGDSVTFDLPTDPGSFIVSCRTFFETCLERHTVSLDEMRSLLEQVVSGLAQDQ